MNSYTKLFSSIVSSSIWREDDKTRIVWITLLALSDRDGLVEGSIPGLAHLAKVSIEDCERALERLQAPDKYSRSHDHDGRRIEAVEGGWLILNRIKYREKNPKDEAAQRHRDANRRWYENKKNAAARADSDRNSDDSDCKESEPSESDDFGCQEEEQEERVNHKTSSSEVTSDGQAAPPAPEGKEPQPATSEGQCLAELLRSEILRNKPDCKITVTQVRKWAATADKMIRLDQRTPEQIARLIRWVQHDQFWMSNCLSMDTLREKFDQLELKAQRRQTQHSQQDFEHTAETPWDRQKAKMRAEGVNV